MDWMDCVDEQIEEMSGLLIVWVFNHGNAFCDLDACVHKE